MIEKNIKSRIQHKHDSEAKWNTMVTFVPMQGELIIYDKDNNYSYERFKIGDGITTVVNLPFYLENEIENILQEISGIKTILDTKVSVSYDSNNDLLLFTI